MAVTTTATDVIYFEDGSTLQFDFNTFTIFEQTDLVVTSIITASSVLNPNYDGGGNAGQLVLNTDYTVTINADGTGYITKMTALSNMYTLVIQRVLPIEQQISLVDNIGTDAATYEEGYDRLTMIAQQLQAQINRSVLQPITIDTPIAFPIPVASTYLGFDANGNMTTLSSISVLTITPVSPSVALDIAQVNASGTNFQYVSLSSLLLTALPLLTTANLVSGKILFQLANTPAGAGILPLANIPTIPLASKVSGLLPVANITAFPYVKVTNTQSSGTGGGSSTSGSWQTAILNTKDNDTAAIATLTSNAISLPAGTYRVLTTMIMLYSSAFSGQIRIFNNTTSAPLVIGSSMQGNALPIICPLQGVFTLAATSSVILQYQTSNSYANSGQGGAVNFGPEVYATFELEKIG